MNSTALLGNFQHLQELFLTLLSTINGKMHKYKTSMDKVTMTLSMIHFES